MSLWRRVGRLVYWLAWPALYMYLRLGARTRLLLVSEGQVLLVQTWMGDGRWSLPGGGLHRRESPVAGVVRETAEETGVVVAPEQCRPLAHEWLRQSGLKFYCYFFVAQLDRPVVLQKQAFEIADVRWVPVQEIDRLPCKPEVRRALDLLAGER